MGEMGALILWVLSLPEPHHAKNHTNNGIRSGLATRTRLTLSYAATTRVFIVTRFNGPKPVAKTRDYHSFVLYHRRYSIPSLNNNV